MLAVVRSAAVLTLVTLCATKSNLDAQSPSLRELLDRATAYVDLFFDRFENIVAEEHYVQDAEWPRQKAKQRRVLRSDFLLVSFPGLQGRMSFRDVFEVDGEAAREATERDRLVKLFGEAPHDVVQRAREITETSARYNLAGIETDPFIAIGYLQPVFRPRFRFRRLGDDRTLGPNVSAIGFEERQRPSVLRGGGDTDLPSRGRIWIEEPIGRVVKTELLLGPKTPSREIVTTYRWDDELQVHVLDEVRESYSAQSRAGRLVMAATFRGVAKYSRFRRFTVRTEEKLHPVEQR
jgi:hypothetical protein